MERFPDFPAQSSSEPPRPAAKAEDPQASKLQLALGGILGFALTYGGLKLFSLQTRLHLYVGAGVGILLALIPYFLAKRHGKPRLALTSLGAGLGAGAIGGAVLALPVVFALAVFAVRKPATMKGEHHEWKV